MSEKESPRIWGLSFCFGGNFVVKDVDKMPESP
jgi:hypothetical protein